MRNNQISIALIALLTSVSEAASLQQAEGQHQLTLYQSDLALITSRFALPEQSLNFQVDGLPSGLVPASVRIDGSQLRHQQWRTGITFEERLMQQIGQKLTLVHVDNAETRTGRLLGFDGSRLEFEYQGAVLRYPIEGAWQPQLVAYPPSQTQLQLRLPLSLTTPYVDLSYLSNGLSWATEYQLELTGENRIDLYARAALHNRSDASFNDVTLNLLAGQPRVPRRGQPMLEMRTMALSAAAMADAVPVDEVQGYQLFQLPGRFSLAAGTSQRVPLLTALALPAKVSYQLRQSAFLGSGRGIEQQHAVQQLRFELDPNSVESPLPSGEVQLYKRDGQNRLQFVGSEQLGQYSPGQQVELDYGEVFDLRAERRQVEYKRDGNTYLQGYEVRLINGAKEPRALEYSVDMSEQWALVDASKLATVDGMQIRWLVEVPAQGELTLAYTLRLVR